MTVGPVMRIGTPGTSQYRVDFSPITQGMLSFGQSIGAGIQDWRARQERERLANQASQDRWFKGLGRRTLAGAQSPDDVIRAAAEFDMAGDPMTDLVMGQLGVGGEGFTLSPGQNRYDGAGNIIATGPEKEVERPIREAADGHLYYADGEKERVFPDVELPPEEPGRSQAYISPDGKERKTVRRGSEEESTLIEGDWMPYTARVQATGLDDLSFTSKTEAGLEGAAIAAGDALTRLGQVEESFEQGKDILTRTGQLMDWGLRQADKLGVNIGDEGRESIAQTARFKLDVMDNANRLIKEMTGAQMSEAEADRLMKGMPNLDDSPQEFTAKYQRTMEKLRELLTRKVEKRIEPGVGDEGFPAFDMSRMSDDDLNWRLSDLKANPGDYSRQEIEALAAEWDRRNAR